VPPHVPGQQEDTRQRIEPAVVAFHAVMVARA
jgi:hypothetical protein